MQPQQPRPPYPYGPPYPPYPPYLPYPPPRQRLSNEAIVWWSLFGLCVLLAMGCAAVLLTVQPSGLTEFACGLGDQNACAQIQQIAALRELALFGLLGILAIGSVFFVFALLTTQRQP